MRNKIQSVLSKLKLNTKKVAFIAVALAIIYCADAMFFQQSLREQRYHETLMAEQLHAQLQSLLEEHVSALIALNVVYQNFVDINHYDFQQYGKSITYNLHGFRRLFFVDPLLEIHHVYPLTAENQLLIGASLKHFKGLERWFNVAKASNKPFLSPMLQFMGHSKSLLAITPIYRNHHEFIGYAAGEISLPYLWDPISQADFLKDYEVQLRDSQGHGFFETHAKPSKASIQVSVPFQVAGEQWRLTLQPIQGTPKLIMAKRFGIWSLGIGLLLLGLFLTYFNKRHKLRLNEVRHQFETIFHASPDAILTLDESLKFELFNAHVLDWSGLPEESLKEKSFFDVFTCDCPHIKKCQELSFLLCTSQQFNEKLPDSLEAHVNHESQGAAKTLRLNASKIRTSKSASGFICVLGDISPAKELERVKENYVATLTHDLKTPLLAQEMVLDTVLSDGSVAMADSHKKLLNGARDSVKDLLEMVNTTLLFYKLESSHLSIHKHAAQITPLVKDVLENLRPLLDKRNLGITLESALDLPEVQVDPIQLKRVFHNIISNAISYAFKDSAIEVLVSSGDSGCVEIAIRNQGRGITPEELPKIFEKYYSLSRKFKQIGTGLGLYISKRIVELHGGKLWAESELNKTTCFYISLPVVQKL